MTLPNLEEARVAAAAFRASLPKVVDAAALTLKSRTPFKVLVLQGSLLHRISSLTDGSVAEFEAGRWLSAVVLVRAVTETTALLFSLRLRVMGALQKGDDNELTEFLRRTMVSSRNDPSLPATLNILTCVDAVEKEFPGFRRQYDQLSEYAHPNWWGVLGAFSQLDREQHVVTFGAFQRMDIKVHVAGLMGALVVAKFANDDLATQIDVLNRAFDIGDNATTRDERMPCPP